MERGIDYLLDHQDICDLLNRYGFALDDKDWKKLATCFLPDAVADYGMDLGTKDGYPAIEATCRAALERLDSSQHLISNHQVDIEGDIAHTRCYLHAQHTKNGSSGGDNLTLGGTYIDEIVRTAEGWRIRRRELRILWQEGNPGVMAP